MSKGSLEDLQHRLTQRTSSEDEVTTAPTRSVRVPCPKPPGQDLRIQLYLLDEGLQLLPGRLERHGTTASLAPRSLAPRQLYETSRADDGYVDSLQSTVVSE